MAISYISCEAIESDLVHTCDPCNDVEQGRIRSLFLIKPGTTITVPLVLSEWQTAIANGNIIPINNVRGSSDGGSAITGDGYGDDTERVLGYDYTLTVKDPAYASNSDFYQAAETQKWNIAYCTETLLHYVKEAVKIKATEPIEEGTDTEVVWNLELKFRCQKKPVKTPKSTIEALLSGCYEVSE